MKPFFLLFSLFSFFTYSQENFQLSSERNEDNSISINYTKEDPGSICVFLKLEGVTNSYFNDQKITISGTSGTLIKLTPIEENKSVNYSSSSIKFLSGKCDPKPNLNFVYALPFSKNKEIKVQYLQKVTSNEENTTKNKRLWKHFQFITNSDTDSIHVSRKGIVIKVIDKYDADTSTEYSFRSNANRVTIEHKDGTLAEYSVLKKNSIKLTVGQTVFPGDFIGLAGTYDKEENKHMRFSVSYLDIKKSNIYKEQKTTLGSVSLYSSVDPLFITANGIKKLSKNSTVISDITEEQITKEMTKRERKKRAKMKY